MSNNVDLYPQSREQPAVLVVDDEPHVRGLLARWLAHDGFTCLQAEGAEAALQILATNEIHVATLDVNMPGRSGTWLLQQIRERYPDVPALMLTAAADSQTAIDALTCGAQGYLLKPVEREDFILRVRQAWERRNLLWERRRYTERLEQQVREQTTMIRVAHEETIYRLINATMCRDEETGAHIRRTGLFSESLALAAGWSVAEAGQLRMAAPMHDVGKIGIPDAILQKPGKLTCQEYEIIKEHTSIGARMLAGSATPVIQLAEQIALCHHERWDGEGYPNRLAGDAIPEAARIVSIVDVYDALSHDRVYRPAFSDEQVYSMMLAGQGTQFDPLLLALFFTIADEIRAIALDHPDETLGVSASLSDPSVKHALGGR